MSMAWFTIPFNINTCFTTEGLKLLAYFILSATWYNNNKYEYTLPGSWAIISWNFSENQSPWKHLWNPWKWTCVKTMSYLKHFALINCDYFANIERQEPWFLKWKLASFENWSSIALSRTFSIPPTTNYIISLIHIGATFQKSSQINITHSMVLNLLLSVAVFSRQRLFRLTFSKVFCLHAPLSDLEMIGVFTSKIIFHLRNLSGRERSRVNKFELYGGRFKPSLYLRFSSYNYCFYAINFWPTKELISTKAEIACTLRQEKSNGGVYLLFAVKNMP